MKRRPLLAFDYDGTLAPLVSRPVQVRMRARTRKLLRELIQHVPVALVSGRSHEDLCFHTRGISVHKVGSHGLDWGKKTRELRRYEKICREWVRELRELSQVPGLEIEDKAFSLSIHYRRCADRSSARTRILAATRDLKSCRKIGGKLVVNLVPRGAPDKGDAVLKLLRQISCRHVIYLGDDLTDEHAFRVCRGKRGISIRVGVSSRSHASQYLAHQRHVDAWLKRIVKVLTRQP